MAGSTNVDISCLTLTRIKMTKMTMLTWSDHHQSSDDNDGKMTRTKVTKMMMHLNDGEFVGPVLVRVLLHHQPRQPRRLQV